MESEWASGVQAAHRAGGAPERFKQGGLEHSPPLHRPAEELTKLGVSVPAPAPKAAEKPTQCRSPSRCLQMASPIPHASLPPPPGTWSPVLGPSIPICLNLTFLSSCPSLAHSSDHASRCWEGGPGRWGQGHCCAWSLPLAPCDLSLPG